jgi:hypothetical protein
MAWGGQLGIKRRLELGSAQCADPSRAHSQDAMRVPRVARSRPRDAYLIADSTSMSRCWTVEMDTNEELH